MRNSRVLKLIAVFSVLGIFGAFAYLTRLTSPETQIKSYLANMERVGSFEGEGLIGDQISYGSSIADFCSEPCRVVITRESGVSQLSLTRKEIVQRLIVVRQQLAQLGIVFLHPEISVRGSGATVVAEARGMGRSTGRDDYFLEVHKIKLDLVRDGKSWKVRRIENVDPLLDVDE